MIDFERNAPAADVERVGEGRQPALDGVRGLAILIILQYHVFVAGSALIPVPKSRWPSVDRFVINVFSGGWASVDLFFVLSGFLITTILLRAKDGPSYFGSFYARRFLRIFPLYYAFLFCIFFVYPLFRDPQSNIYFTIFDVHGFDHIWFLSYLHNFPMAIPNWHPNGSMPMVYLWTLAVEEQFYFVWPLVVLLCPRRHLAMLCVTTMVGALVLRMYMVHGSWEWAARNYTTYFFTFARVDSLAAGALIAALAQRWTFQQMRPVAMVLGVASLTALVSLGVWRNGLHNVDDPVRSYGYSIIGIFFASFLVLVLASSRPPRILSGATLTAFGTYSYGMYILHPLIFTEIAAPILNHGGLQSVGGSFLPALLMLNVMLVTLSFAAGWLSWHLYEKHFLKLKRFFPYGKVRPPATQADTTGAAP